MFSLTTVFHYDDCCLPISLNLLLCWFVLFIIVTVYCLLGVASCLEGTSTEKVGHNILVSLNQDPAEKSLVTAWRLACISCKCLRAIAPDAWLCCNSLNYRIWEKRFQFILLLTSIASLVKALQD